MDVFWSCTEEQMQKLEDELYKGEGVDPEELGCRQLKGRPPVPIYQVRQINDR
jgi:hypothetical protein